MSATGLLQTLPTRLPRRWLPALWLLALALSALAGWHVHVQDLAVREARLQALVDEKLEFIRARVMRHESGLRGARGAILAAGGDSLTRLQFEAVYGSRDPEREFPGALGLGFIRRVAPGEEAAFERWMRAQGRPGFRIADHRSHGGDHFIVQYLYPLSANEGVEGLDITGDPDRSQAARAAARSGEPRLTAPVALMQLRQREPGGLVLMLPVYRGNAVPDTPDAREAALLGWTSTPLVVADILADRGVTRDEFAYALSDDAQGRVFHASPGWRAAEPGEAEPRRHAQLQLYGRTWTLEAHALPGLAASERLADGALVAAALAALSTLLAGVGAQLLQLRRRRAELQREAERFTAAIVEASPQALLVADEGGRIVRANAAAAALFGYPMDELVGLNVDRLVGRAHQAGHAAMRAGYDGRARSIGVQAGLPARRRDGSEFTAALRLSPLPFHGQRYVVASLSDVTAEEAAFKDLARSERQWQDMAHRLPNLVWGCDAAGAVDFLNQRWADFTGEPPSALLSRRSVLAFVHPDDRAGFAAAWRESVATGAPFRSEHRLRRQDGCWRWFHASAVPVLDDAGRVRRWIGASHDIDELRQAEARLRELLQHEEGRVAERTAALEQSRLFLDRVGRVAGVGGWQLDLHSGVYKWTDELRRIAGAEDGYAPVLEEALACYPGAARDRVEAAIWAAMEEGKPYDMEVPFTTRDGRSIWVRIVGEPEYDADDPQGPPVRLVGALQDITERHAVAAALREAKLAAESANAAKSEFLAHMSHEIRTPLNAVIGLAYLLEQSPLQAQQRESVARIQVAGRALLAVVNDVLDLAKIEARQMALEPRPFDLRALLQEMRDLFGPQAQRKGLELRVDADGAAAALAPVLVGDDTRLRQVLVNLLSNALKFTEAGSVALALRAQPAGPGRVRVRFEVRDSGIGIPAEALKKLFSPFTQAEAGTTRRYGGTGLGLSIVRRLAELMEGTAEAESVAGEGSVFRVEVVLGVAEAGAGAGAPRGAAAEPAAVAQALAGVRVLVVDDSEINRDVARRVLELQGAAVSTAADGLQALRQLRADPGACDVVLMDMQMPVLDGLEATRQLRNEPALRDLPVLALSASALVSERERAREAGMNDYLTKPLEPQVLAAAIRRHAGTRPAARAARAALSAPVPARVASAPAAAAAASAGASTPWPHIEGIDTAAAALRLAHDLGLFRKLLARLLPEYGDLDDAQAARQRLHADAAGFAARMHRLRGGAAQLGATVLQAAAGQIETALRAAEPDLAEAEAGVQRLADALCALRVAAAPLLADAAAPAGGASAPTAAPAALARAEVAELLERLSRQDLGAEAAFQALAPRLRQALDTAAFERLREAVEGLEFEKAHAELDAGVPA
ncbi:CHASE domain-containing protein [Azohydromonas aeria]|uniref:CHASE domain-containing protein n=1 Tax=Azohydromonas aeria TaxID=2590212 RepID=UPI0012F8037B|nr:CHASE domain-containing protein [Azohydromonas aeria]